MSAKNIIIENPSEQYWLDKHKKTESCKNVNGIAERIYEEYVAWIFMKNSKNSIHNHTFIVNI